MQKLTNYKRGQVTARKNAVFNELIKIKQSKSFFPDPDKVEYPSITGLKRTDPHYARDYMRLRRKDPLKRTADCMRNKYYHAICGRLPDSTCIKLFGGTRDVIRTHLQSKFRDDMSWDNYGSLWEVDHVISVSYYKMDNKADVLECFHYSNTQPLMCSENRSKYNK